MTNVTLDLPWEAVGMDLDGTLVNTEESLARAINEVREAMGLGPLSAHEVGRHVGPGTELFVRNAIPESGSMSEAERLEAFGRAYARHLMAGLEPMPGAEALLEALDEDGCQLFVLSNKPARWTAAIIDHLGWSRFFGAVYGGDSLPWRKPDPRALEEASPCPMRCTLLVGDSGVDADCAAAAGADFALVLSGRVGAYGDEGDAMGRAVVQAADCGALLEALAMLPAELRQRGCRG